MKHIYNGVNRVFGFDHGPLTTEERSRAIYIARNAPGIRQETENLWREVRTEIDNYARIAADVKRDSHSPDDARGIASAQLRVYQKMLDMVDMARRAVDQTDVESGYSLTASDLASIQSTISGYRSNIDSQISALKETHESLLTAESPEKIREKFLNELQGKRFALESLADGIKKLEIEIRQDSDMITVTEGGRVLSESLRREIQEKQSAIADQKDTIENKKEEIEKLKNGENPALENLKNTLRDQRTELEKLKTKEESYEIRAPFAGTVRSIKIKIGDVLGNGESSDADKIILLENSDIINVKVALNQLDIIKVKIGQEANISFEAVPDALLVGHITEISSTPSGEDSSAFASYEVIISAERQDYPIYSGMNAQITIGLDSKQWVLLVPITAVSSDIVTGESFVNRKEWNTIIKTPVTTGMTHAGEIEIVAGLEEWQEIQVIDFSANEYTHNDYTSDY